LPDGTRGHQGSQLVIGELVNVGGGSGVLPHRIDSGIRRNHGVVPGDIQFGVVFLEPGLHGLQPGVLIFLVFLTGPYSQLNIITGVSGTGTKAKGG
jgi:hypothetical protein